MAKSKKSAKKTEALPLKPRLLVIAIFCLYAAASQPPSFDIPGVVIWLTSAVAIGLVAYAGLALLIPVLTIFFAYARRSLAEASARTSKS